MPNEIRPCTLWGETFDACDVIEILSAERHIVVCVEGNQTFMSPPYDECVIQSQRYLQEAITAIYNALNAPVLATDAVMKDLPKDGKTLAYFVYSGSGDDAIDEWREAKWNDVYEKWKYGSLDIFSVSSRDDEDAWYIIKPNGCLKNAEYLRQFTLDGVRITKEKEASDD